MLVYFYSKAQEDNDSYLCLTPTHFFTGCVVGGGAKNKLFPFPDSFDSMIPFLISSCLSAGLLTA